MNIFVTDRDPEVAARSLCDKHVVKMPLESAQILSAVSWKLGVAAPYKLTHARHPCVLWADERRANWDWLVQHALALCAEYERRYHRQHAAHAVITHCEARGGRPVQVGPRTPFVQVVPEQYQQVDPVLAYRAYYLGDKARFARWKSPARPPAWWLSPAQ